MLMCVLCFSDIPLEVGLAMLKWIYTDQSEIIYSADDTFVLTLLTVAKKFKLDPLAFRSVCMFCQVLLMVCQAMNVWVTWQIYID